MIRWVSARYCLALNHTLSWMMFAVAASELADLGRHKESRCCSIILSDVPVSLVEKLLVGVEFVFEEGATEFFLN